MKKLLYLSMMLTLFSEVKASTDDSTLVFEDGTVVHLKNITAIHQDILDVLNNNYPNIQEFQGFEKSMESYVHEKLTGEKIKCSCEWADFTFSIKLSFEPSVQIIREIVQERIDYLAGTGLPIKPDRYFIRNIVEDGSLYLVVALDEYYSPKSSQLDILKFK